jgi:hypothetical protein
LLDLLILPLIVIQSEIRLVLDLDVEHVLHVVSVSDVVTAGECDGER